MPPVPLSSPPVREGRALLGPVAMAAMVFYLLAAARLALFGSRATDLAFFDQLLWLLSRGLPTDSTFFPVNLVSDHAALVLLPVGGLYWLGPSVHWLLALQAGALALAGVPLWRLGREAGLGPQAAWLPVAALWLHPGTLGGNGYDFHPDAFAVPALLWAVLAARRGEMRSCLAALVVVLVCKELFGLVVAALGAWWWLGERRRGLGLAAIALGAGWFALATLVIIPHAGAELGRHGARFANLGGTPTEFFSHLAHDPWLLARALGTWANAGLLASVLLPVAWGLHWRTVGPLLMVAPLLALYAVADYAGFKVPGYQYQLLVAAALSVCVADALAQGRAWLRRPGAILLWSFAGALAWLDYGAIFSRLEMGMDGWRARAAAVARVPDGVPLIASHRLAPHVSHRRVIHALDAWPVGASLDAVDAVLIDRDDPFSGNPAGLAVRRRVQSDPAFEKIFDRGGVELFVRRVSADRPRG